MESVPIEAGAELAVDDVAHQTEPQSEKIGSDAVFQMIDDFTWEEDQGESKEKYESDMVRRLKDMLNKEREHKLDPDERDDPVTKHYKHYLHGLARDMLLQFPHRRATTPPR